MIALAILYAVAAALAVRALDRRMRAAQRRREAVHFQRSTGLLL
ncbi:MULTISPECIES: hypothetical protein [Rhodanobacter]|nr:MULTISPECIES: hypothetical protein [Rhodanobacter]